MEVAELKSKDSVTKNVNEVLENAQNYAAQLQNLLLKLKEAQNQIDLTATSTRANIEDTFSNLKLTLGAAIEHRKEQLIAQVCTVQEESLIPLHQCYDMINEKLQLTSDLLDEGHKMLQKQNGDSERLRKLNDQSSALGSLPEVPDSAQVPCISFGYDKLLLTKVASLFASHGQVTRTTPMQITNCIPKAGALKLYWEEVEPNMEASEFRLQFCSGDVSKPNETTACYHDVYSGPDSSFIVRDLKQNALYSFRVSCRVDKSSSWSSWSNPLIASTNIPAYEWDSNKNYVLSTDRKTSTKVTDVPSVLYSATPQYECGHSLLFRVVDCTGSAEKDEGFGLCSDRNIQANTLLHSGAMFVTVEGAVIVGGKEMTTRLPNLRKGSVVVFERESLPNGKLRVVIESEGKAVVYDWTTGDDKLKSCSGIYFATFFRNKGWKIAVE